MCANKIGSFDITQKQREITEWRNVKRQALREDYLRQVYHPIKQELIMDHGIHRFGIMRIASEYHTVINGRNLIMGIGGTLAAMGLFMFFTDAYKRNEENKLKTGQLAYADRVHRFNN